MDIEQILEKTAPGRHVHLVGIGGVSMCALGEVLLGRGAVVSGSDIKESSATQRLRTLGIEINIGHAAGHIAGADCVIRTAAAHEDNPEVAAAREQGVALFERAEVWGALMKKYECALCVSGTHGKSTTTSMVTHIAMQAQLDPTVMIGGSLPLIGGGHRVGSGGLIVAESCEYCNSFLYFFPTIAVILNIEADHLDFFGSLEDIMQSFARFARLVPQNGAVIANADDANTMRAVAGLDRRIVTFGLSARAQVRAENIETKRGLSSFDLFVNGVSKTRISLKVPGRHNITNALAAAAASLEAGAGIEDIKRGLEAYAGLNRRFEYKGSFGGARIYDDYAHHPSEIAATLAAARAMEYERVILVFQPHTYTRTKLLFDDFAEKLRGADVLILAEIYAARERNTLGISSKDLAEKIDGALFIPSFEEITDYLERIARPGDLILTVGAGDIYRVGEMLIAKK